MDIKAISIQVQARGVQQAATALNKLADAAKRLDPALSSAKEGVKGLENIRLGSTNAQITSTAESIRYLKNSTKDFSNIGQGFKGLSGAMTSTASAVEKLVKSTQGLSSFNEQLEHLRSTLTEMKGLSGSLSNISNASARMGATPTISTSSSGTRAADTDAAAKSQQAFIRSLEREIYMLKGDKAGWFELQAARKGATEQSAGLIAQYRALTSATKQGTMSTKEYNAALRNVPAQFTDIATQLAGGQNPMLILMQQGGQLKDMFHGVGGAIKAVSSYLLSLLTNPIVLATAAIAGLAYGFYSAGKQMEDFNKSLITTNNYVGMTSASMYEMSQRVGQSTGSYGNAKDAILALAASGRIAGDSIESIATTAAKTAQLTGQSVDDIVADYVSLAKDPLSAIMKLNEGHNFLTGSIQAQIRVMQAQGNEAGAVELAMKTWKAEQDRVNAAIQEQAPAWERLLIKVKSAASGVANAFATMMVGPNIDEQIKMYEALIKLENKAIAGGGGNKAALAENEARLASLQQQKRVKEDTAKTDAAAAEKRRKAAEDEKYFNELLSQGKDKTVQIRNEREKINAFYDRQESLIKSGTKAEADQARAIIASKSREVALAEMVDRYSQKKSDSAIDELATLRAQRDAIELEIKSIASMGLEYDKATTAAKRLRAVEIMLSEGGLKTDKINALRAEKSVLEEVVDAENRKAAALDTAKERDEIQKLIDLTRNQNTALDQQILSIQNGETVKAKASETETKLAEAYYKLTTACDAQTAALAQEAITELEAKAAKEKLAQSAVQMQAIRKKSAEIEEQNRASLDNLIAKYRLERESINLSNRERQQQQDLLQIEADRKSQVAEVQAKINELDRSSIDNKAEQIAQLQQQIALINQGAADRTGVVQTEGAKPKQLEGESFLKDSSNAYKNFYDSLQSRQEILQGFFSSSFDTMTNTLSDFFTTGEMNFKDFAASMMKMISQMILKLLILKAVQSLVGMSASSTTTGISPGGYSGNMTGVDATAALPSANGNVFGRSGLMKYANGGVLSNKVFNRPTYFANGGTIGVLGEEANRSEAVMPLVRMGNGDLGVQASGGGNSGGNVSVVVNVATDGSSNTTTESDTAQAKMLGEALGNRIRQVILQELRPNGLLAK